LQYSEYLVTFALTMYDVVIVFSGYILDWGIPSWKELHSATLFYFSTLNQFHLRKHVIHAADSLSTFVKSGLFFGIQAKINNLFPTVFAYYHRNA